MRAVVTRVRSASVTIDGEIAGQIGVGFLVLLGVHEEDTEKEALKIADRGYVLETGNIVISDTAENMRSNDTVQKAYLGG